MIFSALVLIMANECTKKYIYEKRKEKVTIDTGTESGNLCEVQRGKSTLKMSEDQDAKP